MADANEVATIAFAAHLDDDARQHRIHSLKVRTQVNALVLSNFAAKRITTFAEWRSYDNII
jgi:hypothetical protein